MFSEAMQAVLCLQVLMESSVHTLYSVMKDKNTVDKGTITTMPNLRRINQLI